MLTDTVDLKILQAGAVCGDSPTIRWLLLMRMKFREILETIIWIAEEDLV